ncbi:dermonecrotic toxin domain-containing protein [Pseudomonas sp. Pseusp122]|uniref:dermonecrotic toxin domain-containing protein n=1 Tax=unclassified Pseudomonas TaxID=196821 RepID=UPI0039A4B30E
MIDEKTVDYIRDNMARMVADQQSRGLLSQAGAALINQVIYAEQASDEDGLEVGCIQMPQHGGISLKRLFVIHGASGQYILYVPEQPQSPGDRIFYENHDWKRTGFVLGEFLGRPGGLDYMMNLVPEDNADQVAGYFEEVSRLPSSWSESALLFAPVQGQTYLHKIQSIVRL